MKLRWLNQSQGASGGAVTLVAKSDQGSAAASPTSETGEKVRLRLGGILDDFVYDGRELSVASSNVSTIQYDLERQILKVGYLNGTVYGYLGVTLQEAVSLATAGSKGQWIWDNLRIRGTRDGFRKPYWRVA